jgi:hypothetical protein
MRLLTGLSPNYVSLATSSLTYLRTKLSKALITDASKLEWRTPADLKIKYGTALRIGTVGLTSISCDLYQYQLESERDVRGHRQKNGHS